jgi:hypothetical protein
MFEVYLNNRRDVLVIEKGGQLPLIAAPGKWRKRNKKVVRVSFEIMAAVQRRGYYLRKLSDQKNPQAKPRLADGHQPLVPLQRS